jgi:hypothetical protein
LWRGKSSIHRPHGTTEELAFNSGVLADPRPGATFDYAPAAGAVLARAREIGSICARHGAVVESVNVSVLP